MKASLLERDLWDIDWLMRQGAKPNIELVNQKIEDHEITDYVSRVSYTLGRVPKPSAVAARR